MKEVLPDPSSGYKSFAYLEDQARQGHFKGHPSAYSVLVYLAHNMWTKVPNAEDAGLGIVMAGKSSLAHIAGGTALSISSVQRALKWLADESWVETERAYSPSGREDVKYILVRIDQAAHVSRQRLREAAEAVEMILQEAGQID